MRFPDVSLNRMGGDCSQDSASIGSASIDGRSFTRPMSCPCKKFPVSWRNMIGPSHHHLSWLVGQETPMQIIDRRDPTEGRDTSRAVR
jgi:hypothetical protein